MTLFPCEEALASAEVYGGMQGLVGEPQLLPWPAHPPLRRNRGARPPEVRSLAEQLEARGKPPAPSENGAPDFSSLPRLELRGDSGGWSRATPCNDAGATQPVLTRGLAALPVGLQQGGRSSMHHLLWLDQSGTLHAGNLS